MGFALPTEKGDFFVEICISCGMSFAVPQGYQVQRRKDHETFYCPNGHRQFYPGQSDEEKLREQIAAEQKRTAIERQRREWAETETKATQRRLSATKGKVTLLKRRMGRGQCPCCKEKFADLRDHMAQQHPGYGEAEQ